MHLPRLAEWRRRRALGQRDLAAASGVGASTINRIEGGHQAARPSTVRRLAAALRVDPAELMEEVEVMAAAAPAVKAAPSGEEER